MAGRLSAVALITAATGCTSVEHDHDTVTAMYAVEQGDSDAVREAVAVKRGMEQLDESSSTSFLKACASGQYVIAEILLDGGANAWAVDEFGLAAAHYIEVSPFPPGTQEGDAKERVLAKLRARGFPFPPPAQEEILHLVAAGQWPPAGAR